MNKKFVISVVVIFILSMIIGQAVHGFLLNQDYAQLGHMFRPAQDMAGYFPYLVVGQILFAVGFVWIYLQGRENKPFLMQGVRYGIAIAVLTTLPMYLIYYAVQPLPGAMVVKQIVLDTIAVVILGVVVAWLNR